MSEELMDKISKQAQEYYRNTPVIILGSGASAGYGMSGMWGLSQHLIANVPVKDLDKGSIDSWNEFCEMLKNDVDLEAALHKINLSQELTKRVVISTWKLLTPEDLSVFECSLKSNNHFSLGKLLKHMFRSTIREINIITPNYDRLAEYACEQENLHHHSGFSHGYRRNLVDKN